MKYLLRIFFAVIVCCGLAHAAGAAGKPNIVLIMGDDIGFECHGTYGSERYRTPNIDRLASEGAKFTRAHAMPVCTPSRVELMTGKYNIRNYQAFGVLDLKERTFGHMLKEAGYKTCVAGKWQLTPANYQGPFTTGFDEYCLWNFATGESEEQKAAGLDSGSRYRSPLLYLNGKKLEDTTEKYGPDVTCDFILDFIERNKSQPFFAYYPMELVHNPISPTPDSADWNGPKQKGKSGDDKTAQNQNQYEQMVQYMDKLVGKIIAKLDQCGLRENTVIIITGDNGTTAGIRSPLPGRGIIPGGKNSTVDAGTHVGFVVNWPGEIKPGTVIDSPICLADVVPTLADMTGAKAAPDIDGQSLWPMLQGDMSKARGWVFRSYGRGGKDYNCYIMDTDWKVYAGDGTVFNYSQDWNEEQPVREANEAAARLKTIMDGILSKYPAGKVSKEGRSVKDKSRKRSK